MSSIAEFYSRNLAAEVLKGSVQKAQRGGTAGKAPIGYLNVRRVENGREVRTVEVDPERGALIAWAFEAYATGHWPIDQLRAARPCSPPPGTPRVPTTRPVRQNPPPLHRTAGPRTLRSGLARVGIRRFWWARRDSNPRHLPCKGSALAN
jgi:hypothetical protein